MGETDAHSTQLGPAAGKVVRWSVTGGILALALVLRLWPIGAGLPYIEYIDEGHVLHQALTVLKTRSLDTGFYGYPALPSYLIAAATTLYSPVYARIHGRSLWQDLAPGRHLSTGFYASYDLIYPAEVILLGRLIVAGFSLGTVLLAGALGRRLGGFETTAWAMLLAAVCPALVSRASIVIIDTLAAFFALAALFFCERLRSSAAAKSSFTGWYALASGMMAGFAYGSKYTVGSVFVGVLVTIALLRFSMRQKLWLAVLSGSGLIAAAILSSPALVLDPGKIVSALREQAAFYHSISDVAGYWRQAISFSELGIPFVAIAVCGFALMLRNRTLTAPALSWLSFAAVMLAVFLPQNYEPFRNLLPLVPIACVAAALLFERLHHWSVGGVGNRALRHFIWIGTGVAVVLPMAFASAGQIEERLSQVDSRVRAVDWLQQHANAQDVVLAVQELAILPSEWRRVSAQVVIIPWMAAAERLRAGKFNFVLTSEFDIRFADASLNASSYLSGWLEQTSAMPVVAAFGNVRNPLVPYYWRTNTQRILILKTAAQ